jgi:DNA-directed RNA polymerase alpha subunit
MEGGKTMNTDKILASAEKVYETLPETASDTEYEDAMREAVPEMYTFADEFDKMTPEEQEAVFQSPYYRRAK